MKKHLLNIVGIFMALSVSAQTTVTIQPHFAKGRENQLGYVDSTYGPCIGNPFQYISNSVNAILPEFDAVAWTESGCPDYFRHSVRFDALSDTTLIPHSATIVSAYLVLFGIPSSPDGNYGNSYYPGTPYPNTNPTWLYEFADTFNANTLTWNNQPGVMHTDSVSIPVSYSRWSETDTMNVTAMVTDMVTNVNTGFLFQLQSEVYYRERMYASCYYSDSTLHPMLVVSFFCPSYITSQPKSDTVIAGDTAKFSVTSSSASATYQWQEDPGTGFENLANVWPYSGVTTNVLTIQDASTYLNLTHYRCLVNGVSACTDTSSSAILVIHGGAGVKTLTPSSIHIFPNPAHDEITIQLPEQINTGAIELSDNLGRILTSKKITSATENFYLAGLSSGIYFLKISSGGQVLYKKIVRE